MRYAIMLLFVCVSIFFLIQKKPITAMGSGILFGFMFYYGIIPIIVEYRKNDITYNRIFHALQKDTEDYFLAYISIFVSILVFYYAYKFSFFKKNHYYESDDRKLSKSLSFMGYSCLILGGISLVFFFLALGGVSNALSFAEYSRSFQTSLTGIMSYESSILIIPARLVTIAPFCFWCLKCLSNGSYKNLLDILIVVSFVLATLFYLFNAGRAPLIVLCLCIAVPILKKWGLKKVWLWVVLSGIVALPLLDVLDSLFVYFQSGKWYSIEIDYLKYVRQFRGPINNVFFSFDIAKEYGYRLGKDFLTVIPDFLPGVSFEPSYVPTSEFMGGTNWKVTGGTPNDLVTFSILQFGFFGPVVIPFFLGKIAKKTDEILASFKNEQVKNILSTILVLNSFLLISNADISAVFKAFTLIIIPLIIYWSRVRKNKIWWKPFDKDNSSDGIQVQPDNKD